MERATDLVLLAVGVVAVVLAVILFGVLPETPRPTRQFLAQFDEAAAEGEPQGVDLVEGTPGELAFPVAQGNLSRILLTVRFTDDRPASDPDFVRIHLAGPDGVVRPPTVVTANPLPRQEAATPPTYAANERTVDVEVLVHEAPQRQVVTAASGRETPGEAATRIAPLFSAGGAGTWTVHLAVVTGDCPAAELDPARSAACRATDPSGTDPGNRVEVVRFQTLHWSASLAPVEA